MRAGAAKPLRQPRELMAAMPAARAVPWRKEVGRTQKGPSVPQIPMAARERAQTVANVPGQNGTTARPIDAAAAQAGTGGRRSLVRSEWRTMRTRATAAER